MEPPVAAESPPEAGTDMVLVKNFDLPDAAPARMSRDAFQQSFEPNGFVLVDDDGKPLKPKTKTPAGGASA
jgi:hypothetical protein